MFVMPHQFLEKTLQTIEGHIAPGARAISLIKVSHGVRVVGSGARYTLRRREAHSAKRPIDAFLGGARGEAAICRQLANAQGVDVHGADIHIFADVIQNRLGIRCSALSGANIASEVAAERFSETTIGYRKDHQDDGVLWKKLFG